MNDFVLLLFTESILYPLKSHSIELRNENA